MGKQQIKSSKEKPSLYLNVTRETLQKFETQAQLFRLTKAQYFEFLITDKQLPKIVFSEDSQYIELLDYFTQLNKALSTIGQNSDILTQTILGVLHDGHLNEQEVNILEKTLANQNMVLQQLKQLEQTVRDNQVPITSSLGIRSQRNRVKE
jgi:hypothetical protein